MITRNSYAESMGMKKMLQDVNECGSYAGEEKRRLKAELWGDDNYLAEQRRRVGAATAVGEAVGDGRIRMDVGTDANRQNRTSSAPRRAPKDGEIRTDRLTGAAYGAVWSALTSDSSKHGMEMLTKDIESVETYVRIKGTCLRAKGYAVAEHAEDGTGSAHLVASPLRIVLREENGREVLMYQAPVRNAK